MAHSRLPDQRAERDADSGGQAVAERHALQAGGEVPEQAHVDAAAIEERDRRSGPRYPASTRDGGGKEAPLRAQSNSHTSSSSGHNQRGGMHAALPDRRAAPACARRGDAGLAGSATTGAADCGSALAA